MNTKLEGPAFGGNSTELVYIPLTPCRFIDSRNVGGPLVGTAAFDLDLAETPTVVRPPAPPLPQSGVTRISSAPSQSMWRS